MHLKFPQSKTSYTHEELAHVIKALGFPRGLIERNLPKQLINQTSVLLKSLVELCDLRYFHHELHYTVNMKSAAYNVETLKKCLVQVAARFVSFSDLERIRLAFELYEDFDQRGMQIDVERILKTLKLCGRVIAPLRLSNKLRHLQVSYKEPGRIQFCEFLDLLAFCDFSEEKNVNLPLAGATDKTQRNIYCIDHMKDVILPKDELVRRVLDHEYKEEELRFEHPRLKSHYFRENPLTSEPFQEQVKTADEEFKLTRNKLKSSNRQILLSKGGSLSVPNASCKSSFSGATSSGKKIRSRATTAVSFQSQKSELSSHQSIADTYKSAPAPCTGPKEMKKPRAHSSPPVVNENMTREFHKQINDLQFEIHTEGQRWRNHMRDEISKYIYHSDDVIKRMQKPPPAPGMRRRKKRTRPQPSPVFTRRISEPGPMLPRHHMKHCDAITRGLSGDDHAVTLQRYGSKFHGAEDKRKKTKKRGKSGISFLEKLLTVHDDSWVESAFDARKSGIVRSKSESKIPEDIDQVSSAEEDKDRHPEPKAEEEDSNSPVSEQPTAKPPHSLASPKSWKDAYTTKAVALLQEDFSRVFLDQGHSQTLTHKIRTDTIKNSPGKSVCDLSLFIAPPPSYNMEESEFEKYLKTTKDFTIPVEELIDYDMLGADWIKHRRSYKRIKSRSASAKSELTS